MMRVPALVGSSLKSLKRKASTLAPIRGECLNMSDCLTSTLMAHTATWFQTIYSGDVTVTAYGEFLTEVILSRSTFNVFSSIYEAV